MEINFTAENGMKKIVITNIVTLVLTIIALIWNTSALNSQIQQMQNNQRELQNTQGVLLQEQREHEGRITNIESRVSRVQEDVSRLEDFHFNIGEADVGRDPIRASGPSSWDRWIPGVEGTAPGRQAGGEGQGRRQADDQGEGPL